LNRPLILASVLNLAVLAGAPTAALAQTFPAVVGIAAGVHTLPLNGGAFIAANRSAAAEWSAPASTAAAPADRPQPLKLLPRLARADGEVPQVDIRAKDAWYDDEGLRASPTKVSFKRRF
jgi:hypothetical protein